MLKYFSYSNFYVPQSTRVSENLFVPFGNLSIVCIQSIRLMDCFWHFLRLDFLVFEVESWGNGRRCQIFKEEIEGFFFSTALLKTWRWIFVFTKKINLNVDTNTKWFHKNIKEKFLIAWQIFQLAKTQRPYSWTRCFSSQIALFQHMLAKHIHTLTLFHHPTINQFSYSLHCVIFHQRFRIYVSTAGSYNKM